MGYGLTEEQATLLVKDRYLADLFEDITIPLNKLFKHNVAPSVANFVLNKIGKELNEKKIGVREIDIDINDFISLLSMRELGLISDNSVTSIVEVMMETGQHPTEIATELNLYIDNSEKESIIDEVLKEYPDEVQRYKDGQTKKMTGFFMGRCMGRARENDIALDPSQLRKDLELKLKG